MSSTTHGLRIGALMAVAAVFLGWMISRTEIFFADGLRYIDQAQKIDAGSLLDGIFRSVDHPAYPLAIVAAHRGLGGDSPDSWAFAAQVASAVTGVLLVVPLYLLALELFGPRSAWLGCVLTFLVPITGHVFADALSESLFFLSWTWGLWSAVKFLKLGEFGWLPLTIGFGGLAYLTRPEGLLLPAALVVTLAAMPLMRSTRLNWPRWFRAVGFLVLGPAILVGPYVALKGGLGTKPAIARLIGTTKQSAPDAVERLRPLDPDQTAAKTYSLAFKAVGEAIRDAVTVPLLPLALAGFLLSRSASARSWLLLSIIGLAGLAALVRLFATGGYCSPRHTLILSEILILAAAAGLDKILVSLKIPGKLLGMGEGAVSAGPAFWAVALIGFGAWTVPSIALPIGAGFGGYKVAGAFLGSNVPEGSKVVDVTGWSLYYGRRPGYTFANLIEAPGDPDLRWVIARESHLKGPWTYCDRLRDLVAGLEPVETYAASQGRYQVKVYVYHLAGPPAQAARAAAVRR